METINSYMPTIGAIMGVVVWLIRLEGKVAQVEKVVEVQHELLSKLSEIAERLSYIEGAIKGASSEQ